jgi:cytochrome P450
VAHTERFGGTWLPVRHAEVSTIAHDTERYTSEGVIVTDHRPPRSRPVGYAPPITSDPPFHQLARRLLLPPFAPKPVKDLEPFTREYCHQLADGLEATAAGADGVVDAAIGYAQNIPVRIIAHMLGIPESDGDRFRTFIHRIIEDPGAGEFVDPEDTLDHYLDAQIEAHRDNGRTGEDGDLIDYLLDVRVDGEPLDGDHIGGTIGLLLIAGIDTTWSAIGATLWHLAQHPDHAQRLRDEPEIMVFAVEEFLRAYAPVTMARLVAKDHELAGCPLKEGDWMLLPFPAANRDPDMFENPDEVVLDRQKNRHGAFGLGIHRCLGSNLARMELTVAVEVWLERFAGFELVDPATVRWSGGQIRGPRELPVRILGR